MLESKASNKSLRINNGEVEGTGGQGTWAQFYVHVRRPGVVALQNVGNPSHWLAIRDDKLIGTVSIVISMVRYTVHMYCVLHAWVSYSRFSIILTSPASSNHD